LTKLQYSDSVFSSDLRRNIARNSILTYLPHLNKGSRRIEEKSSKNRLGSNFSIFDDYDIDSSAFNEFFISRYNGIGIGY